VCFGTFDDKCRGTFGRDSRMYRKNPSTDDIEPSQISNDSFFYCISVEK